MKVLLVVIVLVVAWEALRSGVFASLTTGGPAYAPRGNWVNVQTPWGNYGGGWQ